MKISPKLVLTTVLLLIQVIVLWAVFPSFGNHTLLLFIIFTLVGFVVATLYRNWPSLWRRIRYRDSASWPIVPGTIEKSDVHEEHYPRGGDLYQADLDYTYQSNGAEHHGEFSGDHCDDESDAQLLADEHPAGSATLVRVNPKDPEDSVLVITDNER